MEIKLTEEFKIVQCTNAPFLWDLYRIRTAKETGKQYEKAEAYGIDLKGIAERVPYFETEDKAINPFLLKNLWVCLKKNKSRLLKRF